MHVDPGNRLVADSLEAEWNQTLRAVSEAQERYEKQKQTDGAALSDKQRASIMALAKDFPRLWNDPRTPDRERKRMARLLIADVTLLKGTDIRAQVRFNGGATHTLHLSVPKSAWQLRKSAPVVVAEVDQLLEDHTESEIAELLNRQGLRSGTGKPFHRLIVCRIRRVYALESRYKRLRARGLLTISEMAKRLHVCQTTIKLWRRAGLLTAHRYDDKDQYLFERPGPGAPVKHQRQDKTKRLKKARLQSQVLTHQTH
jgi:DNA-binding XRE family transcriptional regulator